MELCHHNQKSGAVHLKKGFKILCSDDDLHLLALQVKANGPASLSKVDFEQRFGLLADDPFWRHVPDYTKFFVGGGLSFSSPEYDMFGAMCRSHDQAVRSGRTLEKFHQHVTNPDNLDDNGYVKLHGLSLDPTGFPDLGESGSVEGEPSLVVHPWHLGGEGLSIFVGLHYQEVRQTVINACLFVEAFVNSVAHAFRSISGKQLSLEDDLYLQERVLDKKTGAARERFVAIQDKLHRWVQLISPRGETFDKGGNLFQDFRAIQEFRDSIVHLSATKADKYRRINLAVAIQAVDVALEIVQAICGYIADDTNAVAYPKWLTKRQSDGLFRPSGCIEILPGKAGNFDRSTPTDAASGASTKV